MSSARPSALGQLRGGANGLQRRPVIKLATVSSSAWQFRHHHNLAQQSTPACGLAGPHPKQQTTQRSGVSCKGHAQVSIAAPVSAAQASPDVTAAASQSAFAQFVAVLLGWGVLAGSCYRSIPQIAKIIQAGGSAEGLSLTSNVAELLCYAVMVGYNLNCGYPINTYAEVFVCYLQDIVLVALIYRHLKVHPGIWVGSTLAFVAFCAWLFIPGACPMPLLNAMQLSTLGVMAFGSRLPQILLNMKRGDSGLLSLTTCVLNVGGCIVRAFTTIVLTQDNLLLASCVIQGVLNAVLLWQVIDTRLRQRRQKQHQL